MEPASASPVNRRTLLAWAIFPVVVLAIFATLTSTNVNGTSIAVYSSNPTGDGLIAGMPQPVRTDEFLLKTPNAISSDEQGLPSRMWIGLSEVDQVVAAGGGPTRDWSTLFKPQDWGFVLFDAGHGVAWNWWWFFAICLWACYLLFGVLTRRPGLSAAAAVAATFTPYSAWWTGPSQTLGYAALTTALALLAWQVRSRMWATVAAVGAGLVGSAFAILLYPPWQVSLVWILSATCVGFWVDRRISWRRVAWTTAVVVITAGSIVGLWFAQHAGALRAIAGTYYPGQRVTESGSGSWAVLFDAPVNFWMDRVGTTLGAGLNQSEAASSWFPLPVMILVVVAAIILVAERRRRGPATSAIESPIAESTHDRDGRALPVWTILCLAISTALLMLWTFVPLPSWIGRLTLLSTVQPSRTNLALGLSAMLTMALAANLPRLRTWRWPWLTIATLVTAALTLWSANSLPWNVDELSMRMVVFVGLVFGLCFVWMLGPWRRTIGAVAVGVFAFVSWAPVNPLQVGISPLTDSSIARELRTTTAGATNTRTMVFGDLGTVARVRAAGLQSVSGTTPYPDSELMEKLAPTQKRLWNNYAQYNWVAGEPGASARITRLGGSQFQLTISPCDPVLLREVSPRWAVSLAPLDASCLSEQATVEEGSATFHIYSVAAPTR